MNKDDGDDIPVLTPIPNNIQWPRVELSDSPVKLDRTIKEMLDSPVKLDRKNGEIPDSRLRLDRPYVELPASRLKLDRLDTLFADEDTFHIHLGNEVKEENDDDSDEDDPFYLSIKMLAKLPQIARKPRFHRESLTDPSAMAKVEPLYKKKDKKEKPKDEQKDLKDPIKDENTSAVPMVESSGANLEKRPSIARGRTLSTGHVTPLDRPETKSGKKKKPAKIAVKETNETDSKTKKKKKK